MFNKILKIVFIIQKVKSQNVCDVHLKLKPNITITGKCVGNFKNLRLVTGWRVYIYT